MKVKLLVNLKCASKKYKEDTLFDSHVAPIPLEIKQEVALNRGTVEVIEQPWFETRAPADWRDEQILAMKKEMEVPATSDSDKNADITNDQAQSSAVSGIKSLVDFRWLPADTRDAMASLRTKTDIRTAKKKTLQAYLMPHCESHDIADMSREQLVEKAIEVFDATNSGRTDN